MGIFGANYGANYDLVADTTNPTVSIVSPLDTATVAPEFTVSGTAADNVFVSLVEVQVDANPFETATGTTSWSIDLSGLTGGNHTITARATDSSSNTGTDSITVTVDPTLSGGVKIEGTHATPMIQDVPQKRIKRRKKHVLPTSGRLSTRITLSAQGRISRTKESVITGRLQTRHERHATAKVMRPNITVLEGMTYRKDEKQVEPYNQAKQAFETLREQRLDKIKRMIKDLHDLDDESI